MLWVRGLVPSVVSNRRLKSKTRSEEDRRMNPIEIASGYNRATTFCASAFDFFILVA